MKPTWVPAPPAPPEPDGATVFSGCDATGPVRRDCTLKVWQRADPKQSEVWEGRPEGPALPRASCWPWGQTGPWAPTASANTDAGMVFPCPGSCYLVLLGPGIE